jgi:uncharacterized DUF497 family protein
MDFQFDPSKAAGNLRKHGVSFADAEGVFLDPLALHRADPDSEGEERFVAIGEGSAGQILVVIYTHRDDSIRLISARRATPGEIRSYES